MTPMQPAQRVGAVILGAGASSRFGSPKSLARFGRRTMLEAVADAARSAGLAPILVVAGSTLTLPPAVTRIRNDEPERGLSRSLQLGIAGVPAECDAAVVLLADQPTVDADIVRKLIGARGSAPIVATAAGGVVGPPVLLERDAFDLVEEASGDAGLRELLRERPELVARVEHESTLPDVDRPSDLEALVEPCPGCGARFPPHASGATHPYIGASPACWAAYGELLAREFGDPTYGRVHRHSADVYAVQHPGNDDRRQRQSVGLHLIALCHWLEHGLETHRLNAITQRLASESRAWPWLDPPPAYAMTVLDVLDAASGEEHVGLVARWAEVTWQAWAAHHALIRQWAGEALH